MNGQIFISYRREDSSAWAGRLCDQLQSRFPQNEIFMDVDSIKPGIDFIETIEERVGACDALVAVIGKRWLSASDEEGRRRLDNPEDFVRVEVGTALKRGVRVIPVLVKGAPMPRAAELPEDLKTLARRNALSLSHDRFRADAERLIDSVGEVLEGARVEQQRQREEQERAEAEQREREGRERLEAERRQKEAQERLEPERRQQAERERLDAAGRQKETPAPEGKGAALRARVLAVLQKRPRRLVIMGSGVAILLLSFGLLFKAPPLPTPTATPSNAPSPTPLASQASPSLSLSGADWFAEAQPYIDNGDFTKALPIVQKAADADNPNAMAYLGYFYENGEGVPKDLTEARRWYEKAARGGNAQAKEALARLSSISSPTPESSPSFTSQATPSPTPSGADWLAEAKRYLDVKDYVKALPPLQKAADVGNAEAMNDLGRLYELGWGVTQDYAQALEWFQKAAKAGNAQAMDNLGDLYRWGWGVAPDDAEAREWYQKSYRASRSAR
jgi:TPR repeat protein